MFKKFFLLLLLIFSFPSVYADTYTNYDTSYNFTIEDDSIDMESYVDTSNHTLNEVLQSLIELNSSYYYIYSDYTPSANLLRFYLIDKTDYAYLNFAYVGYNSSSQSVFRYYTQDFNSFHRDFTGYDGNIYESQNYIDLKNCLINGGCVTSATSPRNGGDVSRYSVNYFGNNNNYSIDINYESYRLPLYSNIDLIYSTSVYLPTTYNVFFKTLSINNESYSIGDRLPTFTDLFVPQISTFDSYYSSLEDIYIGSIPINHISDFHIDLSFNAFIDDYYSKISFSPVYFGRVNHNDDYYTYEKIDCSSALSSWAVDDNYYLGQIYYNGFSCSSNLSSYDSIYIKIQTIPKDDYFYSTLYNLNISSNYGNITILPLSIGSYYGIEIYEYFPQLSNNYSFMLSSNSNITKPYIFSSSEWDRRACVSTSDLSELGSYCNGSIGSYNNSALLVYNDPNIYNGLTDLSLFFDRTIVLSNNNSNSYYYYDSNGSISSDSIDVTDFYNYVSSNYDISYYFGVVNSFIDDLETDLYSFHTIVQDCYDLIPQPYNTAIFVLFILSCIFLLFGLIKR